MLTYDSMVEALKKTKMDDAVTQFNGSIMCATKEGAEAIVCILEAASGVRFDVRYHRENEVFEPLRGKYEVCLSDSTFIYWEV